MFKKSGENIVLVANSIDASVLSESWFIKNEILTPEDIEIGKGLLTPVVSQVFTKDYYVQTFNNQVAIFITKVAYDNTFLESIKTKLKQIIDAIPSTQFLAIGVNFHFDTTQNENVHDITEKLSGNKNNTLYSFLDSKKDDVRFGSYIKLNFLDTRLRVDIKAYNDEVNPLLEYVRISMNFNKNFSETEFGDEFDSFLSNFEKYTEQSKQVISKAESLLK